MIDLVQRDAGVAQHVLERHLGALEQVSGDPLELRAAQLFVHEQRVLLGVHGDVGQVDGGLLAGGQLDLGLLGRLAQPLQGHLVLGQVNAVRGLELVDQPVHHLLVPVVATEVVVTVGGLDLDDALANFQQRDVEGATAEVEHQDGLLALALVQAVGQRGRGRLVDDPQHVQAGNRAGFLGGLALGVIEVRRDGDHRVGDGLAEVGLGVALELLQHPRADLLRGVLLVIDGNRPVGAHVTLDRPDRPVHVRDGLALGDLADQDLSVLGERHDGRRRARSLGVRDNLRLATRQDGDDGVGGAQVNSDRACHVNSSVIELLLRAEPASIVLPGSARCQKN